MRIATGMEEPWDDDNIRLEYIRDIIVITIGARSLNDPYVYQELGDQVAGLLDQGWKKLILDFSRVKLLDSAILGKVITIHRKAQICRAALRLCISSREIREVLRITKLDQILGLYESLDEAMEGF